MLLEFLSSAGGGALAGSALSLLGGSSAQKKADKARALDRKMAQAQFDAQMDQSIQRRVKDAQSAGIHPLFGLGASVGASPTLSAGGDSASAGAPMANALGKAGGMLANAAIAKTQAEAQLAAAQAARIRQDMDSQGRDAAALTVFGNPRKLDALENPINKPPGTVLNRDGSMTVAPEVPAQSSPGVRAGQIPQVIPVTIGPGEVVNVPTEEAWGDDLTSPKTIAMIYHHIKRSPRQAWLYAKRKGRELGLSDQQIIAKYNRTVAKLKKYNKGSGQAGRRFQNRRRKF